MSNVENNNVKIECQEVGYTRNDVFMSPGIFNRVLHGYISSMSNHLTAEGNILDLRVTKCTALSKAKLNVDTYK